VSARARRDWPGDNFQSSDNPGIGLACPAPSYNEGAVQRPKGSPCKEPFSARWVFVIVQTLFAEEPSKTLVNDLVKHWQTLKDLALAVAQAMPDFILGLEKKTRCPSPRIPSENKTSNG
jgi:hypothetical protein